MQGCQCVDSITVRIGERGRVRVGVRIRLRASVRIRLRLGLRIRLRVGGGCVGGSVPVSTTDSLHSTCSELQLSLATTSYPHPS